MAFSSFSLDIGTILQNASVGTVGTDIFEGTMPPNPSNCLSIYEFTGQKPVRTSAKTIAAEYGNVKLKIRNADYETGFAKASAARKALQNFVGVVGVATYLEITASSSITSLGMDENTLYQFTVNFKLTRLPQ